MANDSEILVGLERFLTEFFHPSTSNQRKREIEDQLNKFGNQTGAWKHCIRIFTVTRNEYVLMYCLSVLENLVNKMWIGFDPSSKAEIRTNLHHILLLQHQEMPIFISHKLIKVIVDIGRVDWPMFYPDFFQSLLQLASLSCGEQYGDTRALGLAALRIASEELVSPREDISAQRKEELKKLLSAKVPDIIKVITETLKHQWVKCFKQFAEVSMVTPPPSPGAEQFNLFDLFSPMQGEFLPKVTSALDVSSNSMSIMTQALECLCHFFSWIPLTSSITPELLSILFQFARLGCCFNVHQSSSAVFSSLGSHAMTCINELLTKNCVPHNFEDYLVRIFRQIFHVLQQLTKGDNPRQLLDQLDENYLEKFIEFLRLFVSMHFSRVESNSSFPLIPFLTLLFKFTFNQTSHEYYLNCLDIWEVFIDFVVTKADQSKGQADVLLQRYREGLIEFAAAIFGHIQFRYNHTLLNDLDNSSTDDNGHTEWQNYLIENLEILAKICNLFPDEMMNILYPVLQETSAIYMGNDWNRMPSSNEEGNRLHCTLKDLTIVLQAFGRISDLFITEHFRKRFDDTLALIKRLLSIASYGSHSRLFLNSQLPIIILSDVIEVHAEVLAALQPYTHWLSQLYSEAQQVGHSQAQLSQLLNGYIDVIVPALSKQLPDKIVLASAHTLLSAISTVRATFLSQSSSVEKLFRDVANGSCNKLEMHTQHIIYKALSNLLLLPWPNTPESEQKWDAREKSHTDFTKSLLSEFLSLTNNTDHLQTDKELKERAKSVIHRAVLICVELIEAVCDEVVKTRQICYHSLNSSFSLSLALFPYYLDYPDTTEVFFSFFLVVFRSLRKQMGAEVTEQTIRLFLSKFSPEQLQQIILHENVAGVRVVEKLLKILEMVVDEPGNAFKTFTASIIVFAVEQIYPIVSQRPSPAIKGAILDLLHHLLLRRHRYFFPSPVIASLLTDGSTNNSVLTVAHKPQFLAIMSAFGNSFLQSDIAIFKQTLDVLEDLNHKLKLYDKVQRILPEERVLFQFVNVLIQVLLNKSHDLLQEEICTTVYHMAQVDQDFFYSTFIEQFLHNSEGITQDQKKTLFDSFSRVNDLPSFTSNLLRFVNDTRYYRLCNSSLPDGTVHF